ncbi:hypothetical protein PTTG_27710 [Puccinia triticina 1-1 BBBD Race 1]|uniref:Uncharacterized protein n=2 Tax=Puccinia triticina TaxID=208348 RepID=A0A180GHR8_PUCT1|nr:uncharacterized protein PtA15_8A233 [Puccinia triticina]OAV92230.1 hypothetical protein PTTG_27710 [Puccinia triticina 1-1 BBBD Race 1]WAQ87329.1 hypothetical protein PtA15_8A233 [Puccinia triticina]WAR57184.1 hypothetical protein PtB15_8B231 [Puccinia triticina]
MNGPEIWHTSVQLLFVAQLAVTVLCGCTLHPEAADRLYDTKPAIPCPELVIEYTNVDQTKTELVQCPGDYLIRTFECGYRDCAVLYDKMGNHSNTLWAHTTSGDPAATGAVHYLGRLPHRFLLPSSETKIT